jgi:hypothetical protein
MLSSTLMKWWRPKRKTLREELTEARDNVQRQLDIIVAGPSSNTTRWQPGTIDELETVLAELNKKLADLGPTEC